mmetsp:Transcript_54357/g.119236  ORF Transcript_54357/g.119236 Transcript_54357/m.119236 type:complete len:302 (+) Transcript_54357:966-1871(+)
MGASPLEGLKSLADRLVHSQSLALPLEDFHELRQRSAALGLNKDQILREQKTNNFVFVQHRCLRHLAKSNWGCLGIKINSEPIFVNLNDGVATCFRNRSLRMHFSKHHDSPHGERVLHSKKFRSRRHINCHMLHGAHIGDGSLPRFAGCSAVDWHPAVSSFEKEGNCVEVQHCGNWQHENVVDWNHDLADQLLLELESPLDGLPRDLTHRVMTLMNLHQVDQIGLTVNFSQLLPEGIIQCQRQWAGKRVHDASKEHDNRHRTSPDLECIAAARRLRDDFAKHDDDDGGEQESTETSEHTVN